ncbi:hypothetical protein SANT12839_033140 [Streptomyces antimycoticus]|uniref:Uncharacterized protein n=2 Tax=Streptomyces antimycoticus TaxID=68175 RepID=A0A4D4K2U9_9ACTN|nr:hypothetical protein [Streptomyces antimycoticus]GDY42432.1 hypothetical protein SANT12839_033140 [Streptomyces antimycoticus]
MRRSRRPSVLGLMLLPVPLLAVVGSLSFAGGSGGGGGSGAGESQRAEAQAAKDAAAAAFYELDTAQRDLRISIETITAVDDSPAARRTAADFSALGQRIDQVSRDYITAVDAHDLDRDDLDAATASRARADLTSAKDALERTKADLDRFAQGLGPLLEQAETRLARLAPAVERARQALLAASNALDAVRASGLRADDLAARLAALSPELTKLNQGAGQHGVQETLRRADDVLRRAEAVRGEAERLPERAAEIDKRLVSLRTRAQAITTRAAGVEPVLSELRRRYTAACWQDLQQVPAQAARDVAQAEEKLKEAQTAREEQRWPDATALLATVRALLNSTDEAVSAAGDRLRRLDEVSFDQQKEIERTRFAIRDAQRLAMAGRSTPDPRHARPLDDAVERLERAIAGLEGRHPDWWHFLSETEAVRQTAARVVQGIREERGSGH